MNTGKDIRAALVIHNIIRDMLDKAAWHNTRASLGENERPITHRGVGTTGLRGHTMQPLPSHAVTADRQAGDIIGERGINTSRRPLGKPVRKLVERATFMDPNVPKTNISDLPGNEQHGRAEARELVMATNAPKRFNNIRREQKVSGNARCKAGRRSPPTQGPRAHGSQFNRVTNTHRAVLNNITRTGKAMKQSAKKVVPSANPAAPNTDSRPAAGQTHLGRRKGQQHHP